MKILDTKIPEVKIIEPDVFGDHRGWFMETWSEPKYAQFGFKPVQDNESFTAQKGTLRCVVSKGTYVRTLCHDIGRALGCGGCMSSLRRTMAAGFTLAECRTIEEVQRQGESLLAATDSLFRQYPAYRIPSEQADRRCRCGNPLAAEGLQPGLYRVYGTDGTFLCLSRWENGVLTSEKNFFGA